MGQLLRILLASPRLTISVCLLIFGGISGAIKSREAKAKPESAWSKNASTDDFSGDPAKGGGWGKDTRPASGQAARHQPADTGKHWQNEDGVVFDEEDVKALDPSEYE